MKQNSVFPFILAANRDEFYQRSAKPLHRWDDEQAVYAGRDEIAGGTWLGVSNDGKIAALTNVREMSSGGKPEKSRGNLIRDYLKQPDLTAEIYMDHVEKEKRNYEGFNLLAGTPSRLIYTSNRYTERTLLTKGIAGLSNGALNSDWPKVIRLKQGLAGLGDCEDQEMLTETLFKLLQESEPFPINDLPDTGVGPELERMLSPLFIKSREYGTRCSTVILVDATGRLYMTERTYEEGTRPADRRVELNISANGK
ncbi:NRDE family protein [Alteribacter lacisalsi]|nr:NRDE family protein [Alteribacter lacisalsi]